MKRDGETELTPIVHLEWHDAHGNSGWHTEEETAKWAEGVWMVADVGYLIHETKACLVFAQRFMPRGDAAGDQQWGGLHKIPKGWIRKRKILGYLSPTGAFIEKG